MNYGVVFEKGRDGIGAFTPDLPGVGVVADSRIEAYALLTEAVRWQVHALIEDGEQLPPPSAGAFEFYVPVDPVVEHLPTQGFVFVPSGFAAVVKTDAQATWAPKLVTTPA